MHLREGLARSILAIVAGSLALILIVGGGEYCVIRYVRPLFGGGLGTGLTVILLGLAIVVSLAGLGSGYLAARIAGRAPLIHAIIVPIVASTLYFIHQRIAFGSKTNYPLVFMVIAGMLCAVGGLISSSKIDAETVADTSEL